MKNIIIEGIAIIEVDTIIKYLQADQIIIDKICIEGIIVEIRTKIYPCGICIDPVMLNGMA